MKDMIDFFNDYDREQTKKLAQLPKCDYCHEAIQDDFCYEINGELICEHCMESFFRKAVDEFAG